MPVYMLSEDQIGGGVVRRGFQFGDEYVKSGKRLTAEQIVGMPIANRKALVEKQYIDVYPKAATDLAPVEAPAGATGERHVVSSGFGKFDVIEGRKLNSASLTKEEAMTLAGLAGKKSKGKKGKAKRKPAR